MSSTTKKKSSTKPKNKSNSKSKTYPLSNKKPKDNSSTTTTTNPRWSLPAAGVIKTIGEYEAMSYNEQRMSHHNFDPELLKSHTPQYQVVPYSGGANPKPMSAAMITSRQTKNPKFYPKFFMNPYQELDYMVLQDVYSNSIAGRIIDMKEQLKFGNGIKPVLKLRHPEKAGDEEAQRKLLEKGQYIIDRLLMVDDAIGDPDDIIDPFLDTDLNTKFQALSKNSCVFGRSMIIKEFQKPVLLADGSIVKGIPNILKVIHPRDMEMVEIDQATWKLKSIRLRFAAEQISTKNMIYIENGTNNPVYNALHYGYSQMQSMIGASRSLKQMIEVDFPTITKHVWAGLGFMFLKPEGTTKAQKESELAAINSVVRAGRMNQVMKDPEEVRTDFMDFNPKINELVQLADFLIRYCIAQTGLPQALFAQEKDSNRSTLVQKVRLFMDGVLKNEQREFAKQIAKQWYMPNFKALYGMDSKEWGLYKVEADFDPLKLEAFDDSIEAVKQLNEAIPLKVEAMGELLGLDNFEDMVDPDMQRPDPNQQGINLIDRRNGDSNSDGFTKNQQQQQNKTTED